MNFKLMSARLVYVCFFICICLGVNAMINYIEHEHIKNVNSTLVTNKTIIVDARTWNTG